MKARRTFVVTVVLALALFFAAESTVDALAAAAATGSPWLCSTGGVGTRTPVILVHGFNSAPSTWSDTAQKTLAWNSSRTCISLFDYAAASTQWVTDPRISADLATTINQLAAESSKAGGAGKVIVVAHSMGGLAARCASSQSCSGVAGASGNIAGLITFGTPTLGSFLKGHGASDAEHVLADTLSASCDVPDGAAAIEQLTGLCKFVRAVGTSAAAAGFTPGSTQQQALNQITMPFPVYTVAGNITAQTSFFGTDISDVGGLGDLVVGVDSATDAAHKVGGLGGAKTENCGNLDITGLAGGPVTGVLYGKIFSDVTCIHTGEPSNTNFDADALEQISAIERTLPKPTSNTAPAPTAAAQADYQEGATEAARTTQCPDAVISNLKVAGGFASATFRCPSEGGQAAAGSAIVFKVNKDESMTVLSAGSYIDPISLLELGMTLTTQAELSGRGMAAAKQDLAASCGQSGYNGGNVPAYDGFDASFPPGGMEIDAATLNGLEGTLSATISSSNAVERPDNKVICVHARYRAGMSVTTNSATSVTTATLKAVFITGDGMVSTHTLSFITGPNYYHSYVLDGQKLQTRYSN